MTGHDANATLVRQQFELDPEMIFLNHAALGPWPARTVSAVQKFAAENGREASRHWKQWYAAETRLRERLARVLNTPGPGDIALLKNTSEALSLIATGLKWQPQDRVVVLAEEFSSNLWPWDLASRCHGVVVQRVTRRSEQPVHEALIAACDRHTRLLAVSSVQFVSGETANLAALGEYCQRHAIILVVDAIQSLGALPLDVQKLGIDAVACGSHKWLMAPEGLGILFTSENLRAQLTLQQAGWRMTADPFAFTNADSEATANARRFEAGTLNTLGILGLDASLSLYEELGATWVEQQVRSNTDLLTVALADLPVSLAVAADPERRSGIVSLQLADPEHTGQLFRHLAGAKVMSAMRNQWLRLSPHYHTDQRQLIQVMESIGEFLA